MPAPPISRLLISQLRNPRRKSPALSIQKTVMPKQNFYAIQKGKEVGVFLTWSECEDRIRHHPGAVFKKFSTAAEAEAFVKGEPSTPATRELVVPIKDKSTSKKRTLTNDNQSIVVYSDGACKGNGQVGSIAGIGVYWGPGDPRNIAERCPGDQTNNRAELIAIVRVLETVPVNEQNLVIKTDSQYSMNCFQRWLPNWRKKDFKTADGSPVKNVGVIKYVSALLEARGERGQPVSFQYVKGHSGDPGNDGADAQANIGTTLQPRPDLDWGSLEARAGETINALVHTMPLPRKPAASPEASSERPSKIPKSSNSTTLAGSVTPPVTDKSPNTPRTHVATTVPLPPRSHFRPPTKNANSRPTIYEKHKAVANTLDPPVDLTISDLLTSATRLHTPLLEREPPRDLHNQLSPPQTTHIQSTPTPEPPKRSVIGSPLKASKVFAPLVPVPADEIDFDIYKGCLLEGEEWEREMENL